MSEDSRSRSEDLLGPGVGDTPLIEVEGIYAKLECPNPCGSIKDRIVSYILREARRRGDLRPGQPIVEATSGNTGIALAYYARQMGHPVTIVMPEHMTEERKRLISSLGATLRLCSKKGSFAEAAAIRDRIAAATGAYNPDQFSNELNVECHRRTTGPEIVRQFPEGPGRPVAFVAGVGTGGTLIGVGTALREAWGEVAVVAVEPAEAAVMTGGENGPHGIFGIGDGFVPRLASDGADGLHPIIDSVEVVSTEEALAGALHLAEQHGLCVGVSSGANFVAARRLRDRYRSVITIFADGHHKYHSTGLGAPDEATCPFRKQCEGNVLELLLAQLEQERHSSAEA
jgi:cysteine synthase A